MDTSRQNEIYWYFSFFYYLSIYLFTFCIGNDETGEDAVDNILILENKIDILLKRVNDSKLIQNKIKQLDELIQDVGENDDQYSEVNEFSDLKSSIKEDKVIEIAENLSVNINNNDNNYNKYLKHASDVINVDRWIDEDEHLFKDDTNRGLTDDHIITQNNPIIKKEIDDDFPLF